MSTTESVIRFDPSQRRLFEDLARVIVVNWHRQKGKDFTAACKAVDHALRTGQNWYIVALTQAQADETFAKCRWVASIFQRLLKIQGRIEEDAESFTDRDKEIDQAFQCTARILRLPGGGRVVSLPGKNPDTLAGRTGNMILTEFGLYPKGGYEHWKILFPITTRGGYKLIAISTPRGKNTKFYEIFSNPEQFYSVHFCDIRRSVFEDGYQLFDAKGSPFDQSTDQAKENALATFRRIYADQSGWEREYECQFTGDLSALIAWAELERAASLENPDGFVFHRFESKDGMAMDADALAAMRGALEGRRLAIGWDVARSGHLSSLTVNTVTPGQPSRLSALLVMHNCTFEFMRAAVCAMMDCSSQAVGFGDATGLGMESNETLRKRYRERWTPFTFTAPGKRAVASALKTAFSDGMQTLPGLGEFKFVAADLYAIQADTTGASLLVSESPNPLLEESHCDIAFSLGLARLAEASNAQAPLPAPLARKPLGW
jgi:phage FluMu gp28-like protein